MSRPAKASISLSALRHNYQQLAELAGDGQILAVIKANAYGHGAIDIAAALQELAPMFGMASIEEALELRQADIYKPILLMEGCFSTDEVSIAAVQNFALVCHNQQQVAAILEASLPTPVKVWLKLDTGMHRLGFTQQQARQAYAELSASENVQPQVILTTHLACADELENPLNLQQIEKFEQLSHELGCDGSIANSAGLLGWPQARKQWNRPGIALYGVSPFTESSMLTQELKPVMQLTSQVIAVREVKTGEHVGYGHQWMAEQDSKIATVAIGYGDGYPRGAENGTPVLIRGQQAPLVGRVSMDMISIDVTHIADVELGDEVVLWGPDLDVNLVAEYAGTLGYELLTRMPLRTPRVYQE